MKLNKLVYVFLLISLGLKAIGASGFTAKDCLDSEFQTSIQGKGALFGLLKHNLVIEKEKCVISVKETEYKYLKTSWEVDICREPIHLKKELFQNTSVFKKKIRCKKPIQGKFCKETQGFLNLLRDLGLIFAEGNRQLLDSSHGKTYCAYLLAKEYLEEDSVFVWGQKEVYVDGLEGNPKPKGLLPYENFEFYHEPRKEKILNIQEGEAVDGENGSGEKLKKEDPSDSLENEDVVKDSPQENLDWSSSDEEKLKLKPSGSF